MKMLLDSEYDSLIVSRRIVHAIDALRRHEASSVEILNDNQDFNGHGDRCIIVCGEWTAYEDKRYEGDTLLGVLELAARDHNDWHSEQAPRSRRA